MSFIIVVGSHIEFWIEIMEDVIITVDRVFRKHNEWWKRISRILFELVIKAETSLHSEENFNYGRIVCLNHQWFSVAFVPPGVHPDDCIVNEALLTRIKEVSEVSSKLLEELIDKLCLVFWRKVLVEIEITLHKHIEIVGEGISNEI